MKKLRLIIIFLILSSKGFSCINYDTIRVAICNGSSYFFNNTNITAAGTYKDTLINVSGCDSFLTLILTVGTTTSSHTIYDTICSGGSYFFNGNTLTTSGIYRDTLVNAVGCDSFLTLRLYERPFWAVTTDIYDTICSGDSVYFNNAWRRATGNYYQVLVSSITGCDSTIVLRLTALSPTQWPPLNISTCKNNPIFIGGAWRSRSGFYTDTLKGAAVSGCDSIVWYRLTAYDTFRVKMYRTLCQGQSYFFKGQNRYFTDTITDSFKSIQNCDSIVTLYLTVNRVDTTILKIDICDNQSYFFNSQNLTTSGVYRALLKNVYNCDSLVILTLTVKKTSRQTLYHKYCSNNPPYFHKTYLTTPGIYYDTIPNSVGCDSFITLHLYKDTFNDVTINASICTGDSIFFKKQYFKTAGIYRDTLKNAGGCDSMVHLNLSIYPIKTLAISLYAPGVLQSNIGFLSYQWYFNNAKISNQSRYYLETTDSGNYIIETIDSNMCRYKSSAFNYTYTAGIHSNASNLAMSIYPNPARNYLEISTNQLLKDALLTIYGWDGKLIQHIPYKSLSNSLRVDISHLSQGIYFIEISNNETMSRQKFIKE